jgi:hypothetical protein
MKLLNDEQILGIKHGIERGFLKEGILLSERESWIIDLTVKSTLDVVEQMLNTK